LLAVSDLPAAEDLLAVSDLPAAEDLQAAKVIKEIRDYLSVSKDQWLQ